MPHKDINNLTVIDRIYFGVIGLVVAFAHFFKRDLKNISFHKKIFIFFYDALTAGSIAIFTGLIVYSTYDNLALALGVGGMFGHMGTRTLYLFELFIKQKLNIKEK